MNYTVKFILPTLQCAIHTVWYSSLTLGACVARDKGFRYLCCLLVCMFVCSFEMWRIVALKLEI